MRVLVLIQGELGERPAGPEIRGWEIARAFAARHDVTAAADVPAPDRREGIDVIPRSRRAILAAVASHDAVVGPVLPPYALLAAGERGCIRVADLYDPVDLELGTLDDRRSRRLAARQRAGRRLHLRWSDVVLCANENQRTRTRADLGALRLAREPQLLTVPMGLAEPPPPPAGQPLRERFASIGADDPVILWWGNAWRWLDAPTAIEAVGRLARTRPNVRFVITAGRPRNAATEVLDATAAARDRAAALGLLDRNVFFLDEWVDFNRRQDYLGEADVGIALHSGTAEAPLAARARYMDYLWASLPSVLAAGDEMGAAFGAAGAARLVPAGDAIATAAQLDALLGDRAALLRAQHACRELARKFRWPSLLEPLVAAVEATRPPAPSSLRALGVARDAGRYYAGRAVDRVAR